MSVIGFADAPKAKSYDVVIIGGAMMGSAVAWFLARHGGFDGRVLVLEQDPTYAACSTAHTNSCMRQQFSSEVNIRMSQFAAEFVRDFPARIGREDAPEITFDDFGYLYLAADTAMAEVLRANQKVQAALGAGTRILSREEIARAWPFYMLDDVIIGSHNTVDEGYFDGGTVFEWWRKEARALGVDYVAASVVGLSIDGDRVAGVQLADGTRIAAGAVVNATGPRAARVAAMAGLALPVEPRKRYTYIFDAAEPLDRWLPLTIDPSGVHMRSDGKYYMAGCPPDDDPAVEPDDFAMDHALWENKVWPAVASRVPAFERVKVINEWVGHYAFNHFDQNAIVGPDPRVANFYHCSGFSGHGLQQSPAVGRGLAEHLATGRYESLDLTSLGIARILAGTPFVERAVI